MKNILPIFILKVNEPVTEEEYEYLMQLVTEFTAQNDMYIDDVIETLN